MPPPKKKAAATKWVMGPGGNLVERPVSASPARSPRGSAERLSDGLMSFVPPAAISQRKIVPGKKPKRAPWEEKIRNDRLLSEVRKEMASESASRSAASSRDPSRSPSPSAVRNQATPLRPSASASPAPARASSSLSGRAVSTSPSPAPRRPKIQGLSGFMQKNRDEKEHTLMLRKLTGQRPNEELKVDDGGGEGDTPEEEKEAPKSMADILKKKKEQEQASLKPRMPPVLQCMPGSGTGSWVVMPEEVHKALSHMGAMKEDQFFELRCSMKMGKLRKMIVKVKDWTAPTGKMVLTPSVVHFLGAEVGETINIKSLAVASCDLVTVEVSNAIMQNEDENRERLRTFLEGHGCLNRGEVLKVQEIRFKVLDMGPGVTVCRTPVKAIKFKVRSDGRAELPELRVAVMKRDKLSVGEGLVRVSAAGEGVLILQAKKASGEMAATLLYVNMGDTRPTLEEFMWGGSNQVQCSYTASTVFYVLVQGATCNLCASVVPLVKKESAPAEHSVVILEHFTREMRVPAPSEIQARLPGTDVAKLTCLEKLLSINASPNALYTPPHADLWSAALPSSILSTLPMKLRIPLLLQQSDVDPQCLGDLEASLSTSEGEDLLLHVFTALASPEVSKQKPAAQILAQLNKKERFEEIIID